MGTGGIVTPQPTYPPCFDLLEPALLRIKTVKPRNFDM